MISGKQGRRFGSLLLAAVLLTALPARAAAADSWAEYAAGTDGQAVESTAPAGVIPPLPVTLRRSSDHQKYMDGYADGLFHPNAPLTRAELAQMLYAVIEERPAELVSYPDVPETAWYCRAAGTLGALKLMGGGLFPPEEPVTRAECAVVLVRALWYEPGLEALPQRTFPDVPADFWAYGEIMEATVTHTDVPDGMGRETWAGAVAEQAVLADGCHIVDGSVYRVKDGAFLCGASDGYLTYDASGRAVFSGSPVQLIRQRPQLLNGCEVTSLAMVMASAGCPVDKVALYRDYLPKADFYYQGSVRYGPDPEAFYVGNAAARSGWNCFSAMGGRAVVVLP